MTMPKGFEGIVHPERFFGLELPTPPEIVSRRHYNLNNHKYYKMLSELELLYAAYSKINVAGLKDKKQGYKIKQARQSYELSVSVDGVTSTPVVKLWRGEGWLLSLVKDPRQTNGAESRPDLSFEVGVKGPILNLGGNDISPGDILFRSYEMPSPGHIITPEERGERLLQQRVVLQEGHEFNNSLNVVLGALFNMANGR